VKGRDGGDRAGRPLETDCEREPERTCGVRAKSGVWENALMSRDLADEVTRPGVLGCDGLSPVFARSMALLKKRVFPPGFAAFAGTFKL
jgi:hypothetical protein